MRSDEKLTIAGDDGGVTALTESVHREEVKLRISFEDEAIASLVDRVTFVPGEQNGGPVRTCGGFATQALLPDDTLF